MAASRNGRASSHARKAATAAAPHGAAALVEGFTQTLHHGGERAQAALETISSAAKDVSEQAVDAKDKVAGFIENRPLTSVLIAMGLGALAARMFVRR